MCFFCYKTTTKYLSVICTTEPHHYLGVLQKYTETATRGRPLPSMNDAKESCKRTYDTLSGALYTQ